MGEHSNCIPLSFTSQPETETFTETAFVMAQDIAPEAVIELTKNYLHQLTDNELQEHFIKFSNKFADSLKESTIEHLNVLQSYLRMITGEMSLRLKEM